MKYSIAFYDSDDKFSDAIFEDTLAIAFGYDGSSVEHIMDAYEEQNPLYFGTYENIEDARQAYCRGQNFDADSRLEIVKLNGTEKYVFRDYYQEALTFLKYEEVPLSVELLLLKIFRKKSDIDPKRILECICDSAAVQRIGQLSRGVKFTDLWEVAEINWRPPAGKEKIYEYIDKVVWLYHFHAEDEDYEDIRKKLLRELVILRQLRDE